MEGLIPYRLLDRGDINAILEIQSRCPEASQWVREVYERLADPTYRMETQEVTVVAPGTGPIVGFLTFRNVPDGLEITNLAIAPEARRQGIGSKLLDLVLTTATCSLAKVFLEVRESNAGAIAFYERHGFSRAGRRPRYYTAPVEDALLLVRRAKEV